MTALPFGLHVSRAAPARSRPASDEALTAGLSVEVDGVAPQDWDRIADGFLDISYDQTAGFSDRHWGTQRSSHLLLRRAGVPVAGARVILFTLPLVGKGLAYVKFGPFWRPRSGERDLATYRAVVSALVDEYCVRRGHCLTVFPRPNAEHLDLEAATLREMGFRQRRAMPDPNRYLADVRLDAAGRMRSLDQKWRYNLRQAQRNEIRCQVSSDPAALATFRTLHHAMEARKSFRDSSAIGILPDLMATLPDRLRPHVVLAFHDGAAVAGAVVALLGDTAYYLFGATTDAALPIKAGYALQWWIVSWLAGSGVCWYDLGGEAAEPGLRQFKKGLVGKTGAVVSSCGELDLWTDPFGRLAADSIYGLRQAQQTMAAWLHRA